MCSTKPDKAPCIFEKDFLNWEVLIEQNNNLELSDRLLHRLPLDIHSKCIFHSEDLQWKKENYFVDYFLGYLFLSNRDAEKASLEFDSIHFTSNAGTSNINLSNFRFTKNVKFKKCKFFSSLLFRNSTFCANVDFFLCEFLEDTYFNECEARKQFAINNSIFFKRAYFNYFYYNPDSIENYPSFNETVFKGQANFPNCRFKGGDSNFQLITFENNVYFPNTVFNSRCLFQGTKFLQESDFSNVEFFKEVFFTTREDNKRTHKVEFVNPVTFSAARIHDAITFDDAIFGKGNFDKIVIGTKGRIYFKGTILNKLFTQLLSFNIDPADISGFIDFENAKVAHIHRANLDLLEQLSDSNPPKVYFREGCEFFTNSVDFFYDFDDSTATTLDVLRKTFEALKEWLFAFTRNANLVLILNDTMIQHKQFGVTVRWERTADLNLFKTLSSYFFECIQMGPSKSINGFIGKLNDYSFLEKIINSGLIDPISLKTELEGIVNDFHSYFLRKIRTAKYIIGYKNGKEQIKQSKWPTSSSDASILDLSKLDRNIAKFLRAIYEKFSGIEIKCGIKDVFAGIPTTSFNNLIIDMSTKIEGINFHGEINQSLIAIGENISQTADYSGSNLDFDKIANDIPTIIEHIKALGLKQDMEFDKRIAELRHIEAAANTKDSNTIIKIAKGVTSWLASATSNAGGSILLGLIKRLKIFDLPL